MVRPTVSCRLIVAVLVATAAWTALPAGGEAAAPATRATSLPTTAPMTRPSEVTVVYTHYGMRQQLTPVQKEMIFKEGVKARPEGRQLWFIFVEYLSDYDLDARVYYSPDEAGPRLRKGRYAGIHMGKELTKVDRENWPKPSEAAKRKDTVERVWLAPYLQVSPAGHPYAQSLDIPASPEVPFPPPEYPQALTGVGDQDKGVKLQTLDDGELVRLVDFAESQFGPDFSPDPICWIVGNGEGVYGVARGVEGWGGSAIHIQRKGDGFEVVGGVGWNDADEIAWPPKGARAKAQAKDKGEDKDAEK